MSLFFFRCSVAGQKIERVDANTAVDKHCNSSGKGLQDGALKIAIDEGVQEDGSKCQRHEEKNFLTVLEPEAKFTRIVSLFALANIAVPHSPARQQSQITGSQSKGKRSTDDKLLPVAGECAVRYCANNRAGNSNRQKNFEFAS